MVSRSLVYSVLWVLATMLGYLFAGSGTHFPGSFPVGSGVVSDFDTNAALFGALIGGVGGAVIGTSQWLVLRSWIGMSSGWIADPRSADWMTAHLVAAGIAGALFAGGVGTVVLTLRSARQTTPT